MYPDELRYTAEHEWVRVTDGGTVVFGITHYAQEALGDIVFVSLPSAGAALVAGSACGEVESTKSVSDIYAPVSGSVVAVNGALDGSPEMVNSDPYGSGWMVELQPADMDALAGLLTPAEYRALVEKA
ncbi:MAG TPA: glycine cleavage system protein GcvH [Actinobacteria bacterium]|jgi:glycine cleavage system H protein|nr:glycine cleavage system protein GcvH [Actinomycetota bacterium]